MKENIVLLRRTLGLTQKEFGFNLGCSRDKIANIELGRVTPDDVFIRHICTVFNVREDWLRNGTGDMWSDSSDSVHNFSESYSNLPERTRKMIDNILMMPSEDIEKLETVLGMLFTD